MSKSTGTRTRRAIAGLVMGCVACALLAVPRRTSGAASEVLLRADDAFPSCGFPLGLDEAWFRADYLLWDLDGSTLPPLITASPAGTPLNQAGRLNDPATEILAGGEDVGDRLRSGFALSGGYWLDPYDGFGVTADYFNAGRDSYGYSARLSTTEIIARPFYNAQLDERSAVLINVPSQIGGIVGLTAFDDFQGVGAAIESRLWDTGDHYTLDRITVSGVAGYRYYQHTSLVLIESSQLVLEGAPPPLTEDFFTSVRDEFAGSNRFHGAEFGLKGTLRRDIWWVDGFALVAFGGTQHTVFVEGFTVRVPPGEAAEINQGGLLIANDTNFGRYVDSKTQVIPRFRLGVGARLTDWLSFKAGYNVIVWNDLVQAASHLPPNLEVDPRNWSPVQAGGGPEPEFPGMRRTNLVAHGLDFGFEVAY